MMKERLILLCLLIFCVSCESTRARSYLNAPDVIPSINSNCMGYRNGEFVDTTNNFSVTPQDYDALLDYVDDIETRLYICIKYKRKCR